MAGPKAADAAAAGVKRAQVLSFTSELATLLRAGLPIDRALKVQEEMSSSEALSAMLRSLIEEVKSGKPMSSALEKHPLQFNNFYLSMVRAGEASGQLAEVLERLSGTLEAEAARRSAAVSALIYPAVLCAVAVISVAVMLGFVVPQFESLFNDMGEALPLMTAGVLALGKFVEDWFLLLLLIVAAAVYALRRWLETEPGREWCDERLLATPLVGEVVRKYALAQFSRTLGTLVANGVKMVPAITIATGTVENMRIRDAMQTLPPAVKGGRPLSDVMGQHDAFSPLMVQMVRVGEETGRLGPMLNELARIYDGEVDAAIKRVLALIEPALILVMGTVIAVLIISILMGILAVNDLAF